MPRYSGALYGTDTYGERVRGEVPITIQNTGYWVNDEGYTFAKVRITVGNSLSEYPDGSEVILRRGASWYPDLPGKGSVTEVDESTVYAGTISNGTAVGLRSILTENDLDPVPANSVLYLRLFVREPGFDDGEGNTIYLPWDVRGSAYAVMAGAYGGRQAALSSVPVTYYSNGDPYGTVDMSTTTAKFVSALGFLADTIFTDGALMVDGPARLHPNMVWPLLAASGMPQNELAAFSDSHLFGRLKTLLFSYRRILASRGIAGNDRDGLQELSRAITGYECDVLPDVENLVSTLAGAYPAGTSQDCLGRLAGSGVAVRGDVSWSAVSTEQYYPPALSTLPPWGDLWVEHVAVDRWTDTWSEDGDVWMDAWDQMILPDGVDRPPRCITPSLDDLWWDDDYVQLVDWVHCLQGEGHIGTMQLSTQALDTSACEYVSTGQYRLRVRVCGVSTVVIKILAQTPSGALAEYASAPVSISSYEAWQAIEHTADIPADSWLGWRVEVDGTTFLGAVELRSVGPEVEDPETPSAWLQPYRNPRSIIVAVHTPPIQIEVTPSLVDDDEVLVDDEVVRFNQAAGETSTKLVANDVLSVRKLVEIMPDYLPHGVSSRVIAAWDPEYQYRFGEPGV